MSNNNIKNITTAVGSLSWVRITGNGTKDYNDNRVFTASITLDKNSEEFKAIHNKINDFWKANKPADAKKPQSTGIKIVEDEDGNETDMRLITFKTSVAKQDGTKREIDLVGADAKPLELESGIGIGNDSQGAITGFMKVYSSGKNAGISLYLQGVQVVELIEYEYETNNNAFQDHSKK